MRFILLATLVFIYALLARWPYLDRAAFHSDEYLSMYRSLEVFEGDWFLSDAESQKPPLVYMATAVLYELFGVSDLVTTIPGTLAAFLTLVLIPILAERIYGSQWTTLLAAWLAAASIFHIAFSTMALLDFPMIALALIAILLATSGSATLSGVVLGLALWTKQQALLFIPLCIVPLAWSARESFIHSCIRWLLGFSLMGVVLVLWGLRQTHSLHFIYGQVAAERGNSSSLFILNPDLLLERFLGWWQYLRLFISDSYLTLLAIAAFLVTWARELLKRADVPPTTRYWNSLLIIWMCGVVVAHCVVSVRLVDRYLLPILPFFLIAAAHGLVSLIALVPEHKKRWAIISLLAAVTISPLLAYAQLENRLTIPNFRRVGFLYTHYPGVKSIAAETKAKLGTHDIVYCDEMLCPAVRFYLQPFDRIRSLKWRLPFLREDIDLEDQRHLLFVREETTVEQLQKKYGTRIRVVEEKYIDRVRMLRIHAAEQAQQIPTSAPH